MKILNVNLTLGLKFGGGTAERTFQLSKHLANMPGIQCTVLTIRTEDLDEDRISSIYPAKLIALPYLWKRFYIPRSGFSLIKKLVKDTDIVHIMGHWTILNILVYSAIRKYKKPYVVCPAGSLPLYGRSLLIKNIYNKIIGNRIIRNANGWIAVTKSELPHYQNYGILASLVKIIPNGIDINNFPEVDVDKYKLKYNLPNAPFILFMGRLNPIKGPDLLLEAFIKIQEHLLNYHLIFVGPDGGLLNELIQRSKESGINNRIHFLGFLDGMDKVAAYKSSTLLVVPSRQEAMSIVAIESGICGTPVLITDQCGFDEIKKIDPNWVVPASVSGLANGMMEVLKNIDSLNMKKNKIVNFVYDNYTWQSLIPTYINFYKNINK